MTTKGKYVLIHIIKTTLVESPCYLPTCQEPIKRGEPQIAFKVPMKKHTRKDRRFMYEVPYRKLHMVCFWEWLQHSAQTIQPVGRPRLNVDMQERRKLQTRRRRKLAAWAEALPSGDKDRLTSLMEDILDLETQLDIWPSLRSRALWQWPEAQRVFDDWRKRHEECVA